MIAENPAKIADLQNDLPDWQRTLADLRKVQPLAARAAKLRSEDIPKFEAEILSATAKHADIAAKAEEVRVLKSAFSRAVGLCLGLLLIRPVPKSPSQDPLFESSSPFD